MTWIRDYSRLLKLAFSRKDFVKMIGRGGGSENYPLLLHRPPFHLGNIFCQGEGDRGDLRLPSTLPSQTTSSS